MRFILTLLAAALLTGCSAFESREPTPVEFACQYMREEHLIPANTICASIPEPIVVISHILSDAYYGLFFHGENYIFIHSGMDEEFTKVVIVHETAHYVMDVLGLHEIITQCQGEELARRIAAAWEGVPYDDSWQVYYGCT